MWKDGDGHQYYDSLLAAGLQRIRSVWTQERHGGARRQPRMTEQGILLGLDGDARYGHYMEVVRSAPWAPKLATFAWKLVAGVLPFGKALGCRLAPGYKESTDECLLCRAPGVKDCVDHVFGSCCVLQPVRDWVRVALQHTLGWAAPLGMGEVRNMIYGRDDTRR